MCNLFTNVVPLFLYLNIHKVNICHVTLVWVMFMVRHTESSYDCLRNCGWEISTCAFDICVAVFVLSVGCKHRKVQWLDARFHRSGPNCASSRQTALIRLFENLTVGIGAASHSPDC